MIINFDRLGQSGGGSGSGSTVSWRQDLSAGTQIAQITINGTSQAVYAPEGEGGDYQVVSELPASAEEGQLFYVLAHSGETATLSGWTFTDEGEETLGLIILRQEENDVYIAEIAANSSHNFRINSEWIGTDNTFKIITANGYDILAKCDGAGHCWAYLWQSGPEFEPEGLDETFDYQAGTYEYSTSTDAATYRYLNGEFVLVPEAENAIIYSANSATTQAQWAAIYSALTAMTEEERQNVFIYYYNGKIRPSINYDQGAVRLSYTEYHNNMFRFNGVEQNVGEGGEYTAPVGIAVNITSTGAQMTQSQLSLGFVLPIDNNHYLTLYRKNYSWNGIFRTLTGNLDFEQPVVLKLKYNDGYYDATYQRSGNTAAYVYFNETISGTNYNGVWTIDAGGQTLVSWTETPASSGGGIEKVSELPASAETGDVVWLNGKSYTGYTILCATDARPAYVYELDRSNVAIDGNETSMRLGDFITGAWVSWGGVMVRPRVQETTDYPLLDVIDSGGTHTIAVGENAISMESGVTFPMKGCLYEYRADGWFRKARFEHIYEGAADGLALIQKIQYGIEEFGFEDFVLRFSPDINGEREFVPYYSTNYGIDFQATDSRNKEQNWGRISCRNYRLSASDGSFTDLVGNNWIVTENQLDIPQIESVYINSAGTITDATGLNLLSSMFNVSNRVCFHCNIVDDNKFSSAPLKWWYRQNEQVDGDTKLFYYACAEIPIEGTVYKGVWKWAEYQYPDPFVPQSWTAVQ